MLDQLSYLIYGLGPCPDSVKPIRLLALMYKVVDQRRKRSTYAEIDVENLHALLLLRLKQLDVPDVLTNLVHKVIDDLSERDESLCYFVLVATELLSDDILVTSLRKQAVDQNLVTVDYPFTDRFEAVHEAFPAVFHGAPRLPWDISSVLNDDLWKIDETEPEEDFPVDLQPLDEYGNISKELFRLLKSDAIRIYQATGKEVRVESFQAREVVESLISLYKGIGSHLFTEADKPGVYTVPEHVEVVDERVYSLSVMKQFLPPHLKMAAALTELKLRLENLSLREGSVIETLRKAVLKQFHAFGDSIGDRLRATRSLFEAGLQLGNAAEKMHHFLQICIYWMENHTLALDLSARLFDMSISSVDSFQKKAYESVLEEVNVHTLIVITKYLLSGDLDDSAGLLAHTSLGEDPSQPDYETVTQRLCRLTLPSSRYVDSLICDSIVSYGTIIGLLNTVKMDPHIQQLYFKTEKTDDTSTDDVIFDFTYASQMEKVKEIIDEAPLIRIHLVIPKVISTLKSALLLECLVEDMRQAFRVIAAVFLQQSKYVGNKLIGNSAATARFIYPRLAEAGFNQRHIKAVVVLYQSSKQKFNMKYVAPTPLSLFITERHSDRYENIRKHLVQLAEAEDALTQMDLRRHCLPLGEDRRAFVARSTLQRLLFNLRARMDYAISISVDHFEKELDEAKSIPDLFNAHRHAVKSLLRSTLFDVNYSKTSLTLSQICERCILFANAVAAGDARSAESHYEDTMDNMRLICDKLNTEQKNPFARMLLNVLDPNYSMRSGLNSTTGSILDLDSFDGNFAPAVE